MIGLSGCMFTKSTKLVLGSMLTNICQIPIPIISVKMRDMKYQAHFPLVIQVENEC